MKILSQNQVGYRIACVAGCFGGQESRAKTSGAAAGEMAREPRQSQRSRVNEPLRRTVQILSLQR